MDREQSAFEYVMGLLSAGEIKELEQKAKEDVELAEKINNWQQKVSGLDHATVAKTPPKKVWNNIESEIFPKKSWFSFTGFTPYAAAFASLLLVVLVSVVMLQNPTEAAKFGKEWQVIANIKQGELTLTALEPGVMPDNMVCNLWIKDNAQTMKIGELPMNDSKVMDIKNNKHLHDMFKNKAVLIVSMDKKGTTPEKPGKVMYEVAWNY